MPVTYLFIPDASLRDAVVEQMQLAHFGRLQDEASWPSEPLTETTLMIVDEAALNAGLGKKLAALKNQHGLLMLLGQRPDHFDENAVTEQFAKPLRLGHLLARLRYHAEVAPKLRAVPVAIGPYRFEAQQRCLKRDGETVRLTEKEAALLEYLAQSSAPVSRDDLLAGVWGYDPQIDTHTLETHIYQLRRKMGGEWIVNEGGLYRLIK